MNVTGSTECIDGIAANHVLISREKSQSVQARKPISAETEVIEKKNSLRALSWIFLVKSTGHKPIDFDFTRFYFLIFFKVLLNVTGSTECIDDIAANHVLVNILHVLYTLPEHRVVALDLLYAVAGDTRLVKESLQFGKFFLFLIIIILSFCIRLCK